MTTICGYALDGTFYCVNHVPRNLAACDNDEHQVDSNGVCSSNCGGYGPNPVFTTDEVGEDDICDEPGCGPLLDARVFTRIATSTRRLLCGCVAGETVEKCVPCGEHERK